MHNHAFDPPVGKPDPLACSCNARSCRSATLRTVAAARSGGVEPAYDGRDLGQGRDHGVRLALGVADLVGRDRR